MKVTISCTAENNGDLEFFKDLMDLASSLNDCEYTDDLDFSCCLLLADEKFRSENCVASLLENLLESDEDGVVKALILSEPNSIWETRFDKWKEQITVCYTFKEFVLKSHLGGDYNFVFMDGLEQQLLEDTEQCIQTIKFYRYHQQTFGVFLYADPSFFDVCMEFLSDMFTLIHTYHVSLPTEKLHTLFKSICDLKDQEFLLAVPKDGSLYRVKDVTEQVLMESLKKPKK